VKEDRQPDKVTSGRADSQKDPVDKLIENTFQTDNLTSRQTYRLSDRLTDRKPDMQKDKQKIQDLDRQCMLSCWQTDAMIDTGMTN
jgi:hypothetical protein